MLSMEKKSTKGLPGSSRDRTTDLEITGMMRYPIEHWAILSAYTRIHSTTSFTRVNLNWIKRVNGFIESALSDEYLLTSVLLIFQNKSHEGHIKIAKTKKGRLELSGLQIQK